MSTIRVMTYNVRRCRGRDGRVDPDRTLKVIGAGAPDIVALQEVDSESLSCMAQRLGMQSYGGFRDDGNAYLSYYPLKGVQEFFLGHGGSCLRADTEVDGKRLHLFAVRFNPALKGRQEEVATLLGPALLGNRSVVCPTLILGDFGDFIWGAGNVSLALALRKVPRHLWNGTYPARFPLTGRDRAYLRGDLRIVDSRILRSSLARQASSHLPLVLTVQIVDSRKHLRVEKLQGGRMEIAPG